MVANQVVVELKALTALEDFNCAPYVVAYGFDVGLLINFGAKSLDYRRIFNRYKIGFNPGKPWIDQFYQLNSWALPALTVS